MGIKRKLPPCPDPEHYILVVTRNGRYWRRKRGSVKPAVLNDVLKRNRALMAASSPMARRIALKLEPYTRFMAKGRILSRLNAVLIPALKCDEGAGLEALTGFDVQEEHVFDRLVQAAYRFGHDGRLVWTDVEPFTGCVRVKNRLVTGYFFEGILLYGNAGKEDGLETVCKQSGYYPVEGAAGNSGIPGFLTPCRFEFTLPETGVAFALFLKVSCLEGNEMAAAPRHHAMKAVGAGRTRPA
jgi:hypothetical protein